MRIPFPSPSCFRASPREAHAFTIVELLTVIAIMTIVAVAAAPSMSSLIASSDLNKAAGDISLTLAQARAYAMAHRTYVFVGVEEADVTQPASATQVEIPSGAVGGRVFLAVVAARDGTSGSNPYDASSGWTSYGTGAGLVLIQKPQSFSNVHLAGDLPNIGSMARPVPTYQLNQTSSATPFALPLGSGLAGGFRYLFTKVVQFDPQGAATLAGTLSPWVEIGLEPTRGRTLPPEPKNFAAIQIEGTTGAVRVFRP